MIDSQRFARQAEGELRSNRALGQGTCQAWANLPDEARAAYGRALAFLGCQGNGTGGMPSSATLAADRVAAARLMLVKLGLDSADPRWSSEVLDRLLQAVLEAPEGSVDDLFSALVGVLGDYAPALSLPVASLVKELVVKCFSRYQRSYQAVNWGALVESLAGQPTQAQLYLALHAVPPEFVPGQLANAITQGLAFTAFQDEAGSTLAV